jgi:cytochrome c oxidase cbb3-type subunit II
MYDHPFQWGSKRTGPDLARVGAKYSDEWHVTHLTNPRAIVPQSVMPGYSFLTQTEVDVAGIADHLRTSRMVGVPYSDDQIANAAADLKAQADPDNAGADAFAKRYPKAVVRNFDGKPGTPTEMEALVAYLQMLGTLVDFKLYNEKANLR